MLGDRHQFDVGEAHFAHIGNQRVRELAVAVVTTIGMAAPGGRMHLVDADRLVVGVAALVSQPAIIAVLPVVGVPIEHDGGVTGRLLAIHAEGIGLGR